VTVEIFGFCGETSAKVKMYTEYWQGICNGEKITQAEAIL
jgi:hypothetical protein